MKQSKEQTKRQAAVVKNILIKAFSDASQASIRDGFTFSLKEGITNQPHPEHPDDPKKVVKNLKVQILVDKLGDVDQTVLQEYNFPFEVRVDPNAVRVNAYQIMLTSLLHTSLLVMWNTADAMRSDKDFQKKVKGIILE